MISTHRHEAVGSMVGINLTMGELTLDVKHGGIRFPKEVMRPVLHIRATGSFCIEVSWNTWVLGFDRLMAMVIDVIGKTKGLLGQFVHAHECSAIGDALIVAGSNSDIVVQCCIGGSSIWSIASISSAGSH